MTWPGAQLFRSTDGGSTYEAVLTQTTAATMGTALTALPDFADGNIFDEGSTVSIKMTSGAALASVAQDQVLNGANLAVIGKPGRWEVIQFKTAVLTAPGTYQLSGFLRGRRGSEWATGMHQIGDSFILANVNAWRRVSDGDVGLPRLYKAPAFRIALSAVNATTFTNTAVALMPYAPADAVGVRDGDNNLVLSWNRRSRIGSSTLNLPAQLGEASEAYSIDIIKAGAVVRTLTSSAPSVSYSALDQAADGITPGSPVTARIHQLSATVGRGYPLEATV